MSEKNKKEQKRQKDEQGINEELEQTFPASDPPSITRPGHDREEEEEEKAGGK
jgi:hypothetical protein